MTERKRDFTFRQLSSFVAAARTGSFALAADQLGISQPAVSDHIAALESHLGHSLFERRRGTTPRLTREGIEMLHRAEALLRTSEAMRRDEPSAPTPGKRRLRISVGPRLRDLFLKPLLPRFYAEHPAVEVEIAPAMPMRAILTAMNRGDIDLMLHTVGGLPDGLGSISHIRDVPIALVAAPDIADAIARGERPLEDQPFILPDNGVSPDLWFERQLAAIGVVPRLPVRYVEFFDVLQTMAEQGVGISILMLEQVDEAIHAGRLVRLDPALPAMRRVLVRSPRARRGTDLLETSLIAALRAA